MKKRSIPRLILLSILTLGFYQLFWMAQTRQEMVQKFGVDLPRASLLYVIQGLQTVALIGLLVVLFVVIPAANRDATRYPAPAPECFVAYNEHTASAACKAQFNAYYNPSNPSGRLFNFSFAYIGILAVGLPASGWFFSKRWLKPYAAAVERVTAGRLSASTAFQIWYTPPTIAMCVIQSALNNSPAA